MSCLELIELPQQVKASQGTKAMRCEGRLVAGYARRTVLLCPVYCLLTRGGGHDVVDSKNLGISKGTRRSQGWAGCRDV